MSKNCRHEGIEKNHGNRNPDRNDPLRPTSLCPPYNGNGLGELPNNLSQFTNLNYIFDLWIVKNNLGCFDNYKKIPPLFSKQKRNKKKSLISHEASLCEADVLLSILLLLKNFCRIWFVKAVIILYSIVVIPVW